MSADRLQFGREHEVAPGPSIIKRFFAEAIAHEAEAALLAVPQSESEHPDNAIERLGEADRCTLDQRLHVGMPAPAACRELAARLHLGAYCAVIVDFAIAAEDEAPIGRNHRLVP